MKFEKVLEFRVLILDFFFFSFFFLVCLVLGQGFVVQVSGIFSVIASVMSSSTRELVLLLEC